MAEPGGVAGPLIAFERAAVAAGAGMVRDAGEQIAGQASELVAALDAAAAAAAVAGQSAGAATGGLQCGAALAECADLLARRARDAADEATGIADGMERDSATLAWADEGVAADVADAAG